MIIVFQKNVSVRKKENISRVNNHSERYLFTKIILIL